MKKLLIGAVVASTVTSLPLLVHSKNLKEELSSINSDLNTLASNYSQLDLEKMKIENELAQLEYHYEELNNELEMYSVPVSFNPYDVTESSNATKYSMRKSLEGTNLYDVADAFIESESEYGVNAYFLASICAQESSWGDSNRAKNQNNLTGYAVYNNSSEGASFSSRTESVKATAKLLSSDYLAEDGDYYLGKSIWNINTNYCLLPNNEPDFDWSKSITKIANNLINKANQ